MFSLCQAVNTCQALLTLVPMAHPYDLLIQSAEWTEWNQSRGPKLYVIVEQDGFRVLRTHTAERGLKPKWDFRQALQRLSQSTSALTFKVHHNTRVPLKRDPCLGNRQITIQDLLKLCGLNQVVALDIKDGPKVTGRLYVCLTSTDPDTFTERMHKDTERLAPGTNMARVTQTVDDGTRFVMALEAVITPLEAIVNLGDEIAKVWSTVPPFLDTCSLLVRW
ncbi:hypothetical protein K438DRAFT_1765250 [Mycena galopus ATCC 62051]|nr:hypothetical protein K438DRAFT_1765250 [Mycena galopus ATCC 62051]